MQAVDWIILVLYLILSLVIGVAFTKKASNDIQDFFVAGRSLSWFLLGTSMVATTFSADTPLFVAGLTRQTGIFENWLWWSAAMGGLAGVFFFAHLWRRSEVVTELEFLALRYPPSKMNSSLRVFKVFFEGVIMNCTLMAAVTIAAGKIATILIPEMRATAFQIPLVGNVAYSGIFLFSLGFCAFVYSSLSGLYGVVYTDLIQFILAMGGSILLAVMVYADTTSSQDLMSQLSASPGFHEDLLDMFPAFDNFNLVTLTFVTYMVIAWWGQAAGSGNIVQRLLSARSENDSIKGFLWFNICHYIVRPWPWIIVAICSLIYFPDLADSEYAFPLMINKFMPAGMKGLLVVSLFAAYMSTIDTHLNWGSSYVINDFYKPFLSPLKTGRHYVQASRVVMLIISVVAVIIAAQIDSILQVYKYVMLVGGGVGTVLVARWYWWRVTIYAEITAYIQSFILAPLLTIYIPNEGGTDYFALRLIIITTVVTASWILVAMLTSRHAPDSTTQAFYKKIRAGGPGWKKLEQLTGVVGDNERFKKSFIGWLLGCCLLYGALLGIGKLIFSQWLTGAVCLIVAAGAGYILKRKILKGIFSKNP